MLPEELQIRSDRIFYGTQEGLEAGRPVFIVMRGLPGSGKSSVSKDVQHRYQQQNTHVVRVSTDEILETCEGSYLWAGWKMPLYHGIALHILESAFYKKVPVVILDNTNTMHSEYSKYVLAAQVHNYNTRTFTIGEQDDAAIELAVTRNSHNVPREAIERMAKRFQK